MGDGLHQRRAPPGARSPRGRPRPRPHRGEGPEVELAFWAVAFPLAYSWYRVAEGSWLDLSNAADKAKLLGAGTVFINGVRLLVPLRLAAALALAPTVEKTLKGMGV